MSCPPYPLQWLELDGEEGARLAQEVASDSIFLRRPCRRFETRPSSMKYVRLRLAHDVRPLRPRNPAIARLATSDTPLQWLELDGDGVAQIAIDGVLRLIL